MRRDTPLAEARAFLRLLAVALICLPATALSVAPGQAEAMRVQELRQQPEQDQEMPRQDQASPNKPPQQPGTGERAGKIVVVTGQITKDGTDYLLKDATGTVYKLDAAGKAEPFEGKSAKVTGRLEANTNLLHVESIEAVAT